MSVEQGRVLTVKSTGNLFTSQQDLTTVKLSCFPLGFYRTAKLSHFKPVRKAVRELVAQARRVSVSGVCRAECSGFESRCPYVFTYNTIEFQDKPSRDIGRNMLARVRSEFKSYISST